MNELNWSRIENGWHVGGAFRQYHALRSTSVDANGRVITSWRIALSTRNNPKSIAVEPTLAKAKAAAQTYANSLTTMPVGGWVKR
jgi:hypothetical protein